MTSPFEKHGIRHLSASSLALYRNEPALWVTRYLFGIKDSVGPAAWRGSAVEAGVDWSLMRPDDPHPVAMAKAFERFELDAQGDLSDDVAKARAEIAPILEQAVALLRPKGMPTARQLKIEYRVEGIDVPIIGYVDYVYPDELIDLKTTLRMPSEVSFDHAAQVAVYHGATGKTPWLAYATPKKAELKPVADLEAALWPIIRSARAVQSMLARAETKEDAAAMFCPQFDNFRWDETTIKAAKELWQ